MIKVDNITFKYGKEVILEDISLDGVQIGDIVGVIGPNGAGKSTLFKCMAGMLKLSKGDIYFDGVNIKDITYGTLVQSVCYMPQSNATNASLTVFESILMARKFSKRDKSSGDVEVVSSIIDALLISHLSNKYVSNLSGGQAQLVSLAQILVRKPTVLLLDEPTSALDIHHQMETLEILKSAIKRLNCICFIAIHDLSIASRYCNKLFLLNRGGKKVSIGSPNEVLTKESLANIYGIDSEIMKSSDNQVVIYPIKSLTQDTRSIEKLYKVFENAK